ncbi:MAG: hypothetical protein ABFS45_25570 [Pseudomonadota bacterium]
MTRLRLHGLESFFHLNDLGRNAMQIAKPNRVLHTYTCTALGEAGDGALEEFTPGWYLALMEWWEGALNHFLETGSMVSGNPDS